MVDSASFLSAVAQKVGKVMWVVAIRRLRRIASDYGPRLRPVAARGENDPEIAMGKPRIRNFFLSVSPTSFRA